MMSDSNNAVLRALKSPRAMAAFALLALYTSTIRDGGDANRDYNFDEGLELDAIIDVDHPSRWELGGDNDNVSNNNDDPPVLPVHRRMAAVARGEGGPAGVADPLVGLAGLRSATRSYSNNDKNNNGGRRRKLDCGVILYDRQIPGRGGDGFDGWLRELVEYNSNVGNGIDGSDNGKEATFITSETYPSREMFVARVEDEIRNSDLGAGDWIVVRSSGVNGLGGYAKHEGMLRSWRDMVENDRRDASDENDDDNSGNGGNNCRFVAAHVLSDTLDHSIKRTRTLFEECRCSMTNFKDAMEFRMKSDVPWTGQLDYFLFGEDGDNGDASSRTTTTMEARDKVKLAMRILGEHFDVVTVHDNGFGGRGDDEFANAVMEVTGWKDRYGTTTVKEEEVTASDDHNGLVYSKELVSKFGKLSTRNGDADFVDAVNHVYHNSLGFLLEQ